MDSTAPAQSLLELLPKFNRKERFYLIGWTLGNRKFRASAAFLRSISSLIGVAIPRSAIVAMDYHFSWLFASLFLASGEARNQEVFDNGERLVTGSQEDVDLLIAFQKDRTTHVVMLEAKAATGWTNQQARSKAKRLGEIFGRDGRRWRFVRPHFVLASPRPPQRLDLTSWPAWMKRPDGSPYWIAMPMMKGLVKTTRCDKNGNADDSGTFWTTTPRMKQHASKMSMGVSDDAQIAVAESLRPDCQPD